MTATEDRAVMDYVTNEVLEEAKQALITTDWCDYWSKVQSNVAKDVDAFADARAKAWSESSHRMMR